MKPTALIKQTTTTAAIVFAARWPDVPWRESRAKIVWLVLSVLMLHTANTAWAGNTVTAWGYNYFGQTNVPAGLTNVVAIAAGDDSCLALLDNGLVTMWGNFPSTGTLSNAVAVAGGGLFGLALRADGTVAASGIYYNGSGFPPMMVPTGLSNVVSIAAGHDHGLALCAGGAVVAWGNNVYGQANVPPGLSNVVMVAGGFGHSLALRADRTVVAWGNGAQGETNVPVGLTNAIGIAAGYDDNLALRADGTVVAWGSNIDGQPNAPAGLTNVVAIASGGYHYLGLRVDGTVVAWGLNDYGDGTIPHGLSNVVAIAAGYWHSLALVGSGPLITQASLANPFRSNANFSVSLPTQNGRVYGLEFKNSLSDDSWTPLPLVAGNGNSRTLTDSTATNTQRFYRVRWW